MKSIVESLNSLQIYHKSRTAESILHRVNVEDISVKSFHTLFSTIYVLEARLKNYGGAGPQKWEPRSRIGLYLGHYPFHDESVSLVCNTATGRVSPQYHVVLTISLVLCLTWKQAPSHQTGRTLSNSPPKWPQPKMSIWQTLVCGVNLTRDCRMRLQIPSQF